MPVVISWVNNNYRIIVAAFFAIYLIIGIRLFTDYGVSWDEKFQRTIGKQTYNYLTQNNPELFQNHNHFYGSIFEVALIVAEKILHLKDSRDICFLRHLAVFLTFYLGVFFFYKLCRYHFHNWAIGLLGSLFLILSPRLFAHSFYNPKDIPFLAMFIISIYTLIGYLDKKTFRHIFCHALACALLIDLRVIGMMVPCFTAIFVFTRIQPARENLRQTALSFSLYTGLLAALTILFWPFLWQNPLFNFIAAVKEMVKYPWIGKVLYLGSYLEATRLPWHYTPVCIAISTPLVYIIFFVLGLAGTIKNVIFNRLEPLRCRRNDFIFLLWLFFPLSAIIICRSTLYDSWRQMFFVYPAILIFALRGITGFGEFIKMKLTGRIKLALNTAVAVLIAVNLGETAWSMATAHPYQDIYFNALAGNPRNIRNNFDLDYWGLSYRQGLEYILQTDEREIIKICPANFGAKWNYYILPPSYRRRIHFTDNILDADYFISNFRFRKDDYPDKKEYYALIIRGLKILVVYRF